MEKSNPIWITRGSRDLLLELLSTREQFVRTRPFPIQQSMEHSSSELTYVWFEEELAGREPPVAIIGSETALDDLIAWSSAFLRPFSPLSSLVSLYSAGQWNAFVSDDQRDPPIKTQGAYIGIIFGELFGQTGRTIELNDLALGGCQSTMSYAILRGLSAGTSPDELQMLPTRWNEARQVLDQEPSRVPVADLVTAIRSLIVLEHMDGRPTSDPVVDLMQCFRSENFEAAAKKLASLFPELPVLLTIARLPSEDRVTIFESIAPVLANRSNGNGMALACAAALCRPGAFDVIGLLNRFLAQVPDVGLWFGVFQGLVPKNNLLYIGDGLGWRVWRDAFRRISLSERPSGDISLRELKVLARHRGGAGLAKFARTDSRSRLYVEVAPGVTIPVRTNADVPGKGVNTGQQKGLFEGPAEASIESDQQRAEMFTRIEKLSETLHRALNELYLLREVSRSTDARGRPNARPRGKR